MKIIYIYQIYQLDFLKILFTSQDIRKNNFLWKYFGY